MPEIALGTKVFSRAKRLGKLLNSVSETPIDTVYVADDGEPSRDKKALYEANYEFNLEVLDLEYDAGLGYGRNRIVEASEDARRIGHVEDGEEAVSIRGLELRE